MVILRESFHFYGAPKVGAGPVNVCLHINGITKRHCKSQRDHPFKTSACLRGGGVSPCANGQKVTVNKDKKSPS